MREPATLLDVHGDIWAARIRAEHERRGIFCPCRNYDRDGVRVDLHLSYDALGALPADTNTPRHEVLCDLPKED